MSYQTHSGISQAVFYTGEEDRIGRPGEVETEKGKITKVKLGRNADWVDFNQDYLQGKGITLITFYSPMTLSIPELETPEENEEEDTSEEEE